MPAFLVQSTFSRGDLQLLLSNDLGQAQDGYDVRWTVFRQDGTAASGRGLPAVKAGPGEYYAPWGCGRSNGCHRIRWEWRDLPGGPVREACQEFFVAALSSFQCCSSCSGASSASCGAFFCGKALGPGDLSITVRDENGVPYQPYAVFYTVFRADGCALIPRAPGLPGQGVGEFWASFVPPCGGDFLIRWEFMEDAESGFEAVCQSFSVLSQSYVASAIVPMCELIPETCCTGCSSGLSCSFLSPHSIGGITDRNCSC